MEQFYASAMGKIYENFLQSTKQDIQQGPHHGKWYRLESFTWPNFRYQQPARLVVRRKSLEYQRSLFAVVNVMTIKS